jgi:hypothetical protein
MFKLITPYRAVNKKHDEHGAALLFAVMASLIGLALAFILMATTTQNLNVAFFNTKDLRIQTANDSAVESAIQLINSGYDYRIHNELNPYVTQKTITVGANIEVVSRTEWWVQKFDLTNTNACLKDLQGYTPGTVEYLVVGAGGSGGNHLGAGGGGGGFVSGETILTAGEHSVIVGAGGFSVTGYQAGVDGQDSQFANIVAAGGGGGGAVSDIGLSLLPNSGGSGGGATKASGSTATILGGLGTPGQGNQGGDTTGAALTTAAGSGGGGASASGNSAENNVGGSGGNGLSSNITGVSIFYSGGGGGAAASGGTAGAGGSGGGGSGGLGVATAGSGINNTGGGGGGGYDGTSSTSGAGGDGIVVVRYPIEISGTTIEMLATGGEETEETIDNIKYKIHSFNIPGENVFNLISTGEPKHLCGLTITATTTTPYYSDEDTLTTKTTLVPMQYSLSQIVDNIIQYSPSGESIFRTGIYAKNNLRLNEDTKLYSYFANDTLNGASAVLTSSLSIKKATLSAGNSLIVDSSSISNGDLQTATIEAKNNTEGVYLYADCSINDNDCLAQIVNKQNHQTIFTSHNDWMDSVCNNNYKTNLNLNETIPEGITCVDGDVSLSRNTILGTYDNPSILIVTGNVLFLPDTVLNENRTPRLLQIYTEGNIDYTATTDETSSINALIAATGSNSSINLNASATNASLIFYGNIIGHNITTNGDVTIWQEISSKFIDNSDNKTLYQKANKRYVNYSQKPFNLSGMGRVFGEKITSESIRSENVNPQGGDN